MQRDIFEQWLRLNSKSFVVFENSEGEKTYHVEITLPESFEIK
jgi:hypothetical protein